jgi:5-methylthioadenosine/S-adenosylhomocysteine deaminase
MTQHPMNRRTILKGATALGALLATPHGSLAQPAPARTAKGPSATLPPRGEFVIRGATVLTMDPKIDDLATGDVHVRDGAIVAVAAKVDAPKAQVIDGGTMICMPGFIDTHWHLWASLLRPFARADVPALG